MTTNDAAPPSGGPPPTPARPTLRLTIRLRKRKAAHSDMVRLRYWIKNLGHAWGWDVLSVEAAPPPDPP